GCAVSSPARRWRTGRCSRGSPAAAPAPGGRRDSGCWGCCSAPRTPASAATSGATWGPPRSCPGTARGSAGLGRVRPAPPRGAAGTPAARSPAARQAPPALPRPPPPPSPSPRSAAREPSAPPRGTPHFSGACGSSGAAGAGPRPTRRGAAAGAGASPARASPAPRR
uniref:Uncharacterized protein n=1 Tax=Cricetulus griseus TaxID=10029 RepID=A0A8C2LVQ3_CRIGR